MAVVNYKILIVGLPYKTDVGSLGYSSIVLLNDGKDSILFDVGHYAVRAEIIRIMKKYKITKVFLSHLHYDHCLNADLFQQAKIKLYLNRKEWQYLEKIRSNDIYTFCLFKKMIRRKSLILFDGAFNITKNIRAIETIGHTAGHSSLTFDKGRLRYIVAGDAIKTPADLAEIEPDVPPYNLKMFKKTRRYIINGYDIIIPGHANVIKQGSQSHNSIKLKRF
ncbi:MAG: MBL fold metallo-hydrolase [Patescibacteria group bacterium]